MESIRAYSERRVCQGVRSVRRPPQSPNEPDPSHVPLPDRYAEIGASGGKTAFRVELVAQRCCSLIAHCQLRAGIASGDLWEPALAVCYPHYGCHTTARGMFLY